MQIRRRYERVRHYSNKWNRLADSSEVRYRDVVNQSPHERSDSYHWASFCRGEQPEQSLEAVRLPQPRNPTRELPSSECLLCDEWHRLDNERLIGIDGADRSKIPTASVFVTC